MLLAFALVAFLQDAPAVPAAPYIEDAIPSTGRADPRLTAFDKAMRDFLRDGHIPGATLAVAKDGRLIYSRGFGWADEENKIPMQPDALLRIASLSKPITSAMLMMLVQQDKMAVEDLLFTHLDARLARGRTPLDPRWFKITLDQLLHHRGGFDRALSGDSVFQPFRMGRLLGMEGPADRYETISAMLRKPLDFDPGKRFAYSNFGYSLLGRVIEHSTKSSYETAVRKQLLEPLGIDDADMHIGGSLLSERKDREAIYHSSEVGKALWGKGMGKLAYGPYGTWSQPDLDAFAGWVASAPALLRFSHVFDPAQETGLLDLESISKILAHPKDKAPGANAPTWYGSGWEVRSHGKGHYTAWHSGSLPGTAALWVMRADGLSWVVLFNARADKEDNYLAVTIDPELHKAASATSAWPVFDLFEQSPSDVEDEDPGEAPADEKESE